MSKALIKKLRDRGVRVETIHTFNDLERVRDEFIKGVNGFFTNFLVLVGTPGIGKSSKFQGLPDTYYTNSAVSAVGLYRLAYINIDKPLIIDDVDELLVQKPVISLLKALTNDGPVKTVSWEKQNSELLRENIPNQFTTRSRLCILANEFPKVNGNVRAVFDRAKVLFFQPTAEVVHEFVHSWWSPEHGDVYEFIGANLHRITHPSMRWYNDALREKRLGNNWRDWLVRQWVHGNAYQKITREILACGLKGKEAAAAWHQRTGQSRASWYNYRKEYGDESRPPMA